MSQFVPQINKVKGISDKRRMPRLGKIRLGLKIKSQKTGKEYPKEVDFFVCPPEVEKQFGKEPKRLEIMFPLNEPEAVFPQSLTWYGKSRGVKCKGDNEVAYRWHEECQGQCLDHKPEELWHKRNCPCELLDKGCSLRGHLLFMIPAVNMGGIYQLDTGSYHSTVDVNSGIDYVRELMQSATGQDRFALIPLILERVPRKTGGGESGAQQTHYTLRLTCSVTLQRLAEMRKDPGMIYSERLALPEPIDENPEADAPDLIVEVEDEEKIEPPEEPTTPPTTPEVLSLHDRIARIQDDLIDKVTNVTEIKRIITECLGAEKSSKEFTAEDCDKLNEWGYGA